MLQWLLFGGTPLLAAVWIVAAALRAPPADRLRAAGRAAIPALGGLVLLYAIAGTLVIGWMIVVTLAQ